MIPRTLLANIGVLITFLVLLLGAPSILGLFAFSFGFYDVAKFFNVVQILWVIILLCAAISLTLGYHAACYLAGIARNPDGGDPRIIQTSILVQLPLFCTYLGFIIGIIIDTILLLKWL